MNIALSTTNNDQSDINSSFDSNINNDSNLDDSSHQQSQSNLNINSQEENKKSKIPRIDSSILFQSNSLSNSEGVISTPFLKSVPSTQIPLISINNDSDIINSNGSIENFNAILQSSKSGNFSPDIEITNYFYDLFRREINAPQSMTKEELLTFFENYSIENYARKHFRKQQGIILFTNQSIKELTTFSMKPLSKPLLEKTRTASKSAALKLNTYILTFIDALTDAKQEEIYKGRRNEYKNDLTMAIVKMLHDDECLVNEFFMQMIKLMRNSPNRETLLLSWKLFLTSSTLFYVKDHEISNVIRWFLFKCVSENGEFVDYAYYAFIRFHDRNVLEKNYDFAKIKKEQILRIPSNVQIGTKMFKCSLYVQMWNQKRIFPKLPIPLTLYLVVKTLIKNGVMVTPNPFPDIGRNVPKSATSKSTNNIGNQEQSQKEKEEASKDIISMKNDEVNDNDDDDSDEADDAADADAVVDDDDGASSKDRDIHYKKADMKIVKMWVSNLNSDYDIINDGEVRNLLALAFIWMINLLDPIIPKCMANSFIETFKADKTDPSYNQKCKEFVENLPLLHKNTLKFLVGFFRDVVRNGKYTNETHQTISDYIGFYFVETSFMTIDPFTRKEMRNVSSAFLLYCFENLDVADIYPLNPACTHCISEIEEEKEEETTK